MKIIEGGNENKKGKEEGTSKFFQNELLLT